MELPWVRHKMSRISHSQLIKISTYREQAGLENHSENRNRLTLQQNHSKSKRPPYMLLIALSINNEPIHSKHRLTE